MNKRILIVEDDTALAQVVSDNLVFEGFVCECVADGTTAVARFRQFNPDLVLLDIMLPDIVGFDLCGVLRERGSTPVIMLTARGQKEDKLRGLKLGADDYITKPFDMDELVARIHVVLRRTRSVASRLVLGPVTVDFRLQLATRSGRMIHLSRKEFDILQYLAEREGQIVHRDELLRDVWGYPQSPLTRSVDYAILRIRRKIEGDPRHPRFIHSVRGDGYCLTCKASSPTSP